MGKQQRRLIAVLAAAGFLLVPSAVFAEESASANDLQPAQIVSVEKMDAFAVYAKSDKGVTVEAAEPARTAKDGEVFTMRIKLNGGGAWDYRSIHFTAKGAAEVVVYLNSSHKTDARILKVADAAGNIVSEQTAPPDNGIDAGMATFSVPKEGEYAIFSANSGINVYRIDVK
jgi:hypothetical protein